MSTRRCMHPLRRRGQTPAARMLDTPSGLASSCPTDAIGGQCTRDCSRARQCHGFEVTAKTQEENAIVRSQPTGNTDAPMSAATSAPLFSRSAGPLAIAAGTLLIVGQAIWWPFDQQKNLPQHKMTSSTPAASSTFVASAYSCSPSSVSTEGRRTGLGGWVGSVSLPPSWARCCSWGPVVRTLCRSVACRGPVSAGSQQRSVYSVRPRCNLELPALRYWSPSRGQTRWRLVTLLRVCV
jgi:hypothetical protein